MTRARVTPALDGFAIVIAGTLLHGTPEDAAELRDELDRALDPRPTDLAGILARLSEQLGELGVAVGELRADYGPWPDEEVRPALSLSEPAGGAIRAAWVLLREAAERAPAGYPGPNA